MRSKVKPHPDDQARRRAWWACVFVVLGFSLLSCRLVFLHLVKHEDLAKEAASFQIKTQKLPSKRGEIVDRNGELLASDQRVYNLYADKNHLREFNLACYGVAKATGIDSNVVKRRYDREEILQVYESYVAKVLHTEIGWTEDGLAAKLALKDRGKIPLVNGVEEDAHRSMAAILETAGIRGVYFDAESRRFYPSPHYLTHVLGYVDRKNTGKEGIERTMDHVLRGTDGWRRIERDSRGREIAAFRREEVAPVNGKKVRLTIDMGLQTIIENQLDAAVARFTPEKITAIFMDPNTGEILAMASRPHFDLETREGERRNIAISDQYEPGSTFKIVTLGGALDLRLVGLDTRVFCHWGEYHENRLTVHDHHAYGDLTARMVLAKSSNIGAYKIAKELGPVRFHQYMGYFGFGEPTGIRLTGETSGQIFPPSQWSGTSFSSMAMGYEVAVTPLQMITALGAIANGGLLLRPRVIHSIEDENDQMIEKTDTVVVRRVLSSAAAESVRKAMLAVTSEGGTGTQGVVPGFDVAGKTGTARKFSPELGRYLDGQYVVSFMGFLPAENPKIMGIVVVDDPKATDMSLYGGTVAAPIFAEMARLAATYLELEPTAVVPAPLVQNQ